MWCMLLTAGCPALKHSALIHKKEGNAQKHESYQKEGKAEVFYGRSFKRRVSYHHVERDERTGLE